MKYHLLLRTRPYNSIKNKTKKIEGRTPKDSRDRRYNEMKKGDIIVFENEETLETLETRVLFVHHYVDVKTMLEKEGTENVLSSGKNIDEGIKSYHSLGNYEERIKQFGIYAIGIEPIEE